MEKLGHFPMSENPKQFRTYIAPVLQQILQAETTRPAGEHKRTTLESDATQLNRILSRFQPKWVPVRVKDRTRGCDPQSLRFGIEGEAYSASSE
jgi:hypothetical protein